MGLRAVGSEDSSASRCGELVAVGVDKPGDWPFPGGRRGALAILRHHPWKHQTSSALLQDAFTNRDSAAASRLNDPSEQSIPLSRPIFETNRCDPPLPTALTVEKVAGNGNRRAERRVTGDLDSRTSIQSNGG